MKKFLILIVLLGSGLGMRAQQVDNFTPGEILVSPAIGLGTPYLGGLGYSTVLPPISVSVDYGIEQDVVDEGTVSIGGYFGIAQNRFRTNYFGGEYGWNYTYIVLGPRGVYTYPIEENLDIYGGLMLGFNIATAREVGDVPGNVSSSGGGFAYDFFAGGRYFFQDNLAAMLELGYGVSILRLGVSIKI
ncbi:hypothetical protein [Halocola ammonii]